jgi:hypothetical protein
MPSNAGGQKQGNYMLLHIKIHGLGCSSVVERLSWV